MTTLGQIPPALQHLLTDMRDRASRLAPLAPETGRLVLVDLDLIKPLLAEKATMALLASLLAPAEHSLFAGFRYPKRRLEWLGGRLAGKYSLALLTGHDNEPCLSSFCDIPILPDAHGRPLFAARAEQPPVPALSISHSHRFAAALARRLGPCGLDIQQPAAKLFTVRERFATDGEVALMHSIPDPLVRLTALWAIKEAVKKGWLHDQSTFLGRIMVTTLTKTPGSTWWTAHCALAGGGPASVTVRVADIDGYLIAYTGGETRA